MNVVRACVAAFCVVLLGVIDLRAADLSQDVRTVLLRFQAEHGFPGATAAYVLPDGTSAQVAVGQADVEANVPMRPETRMLAASIGKTFVGALVLMLESEGLLSRDDRLADTLGTRNWFGQLPNGADITLGQLLTHSAGVPDHVHMAGVLDKLLQMPTDAAFDPEDLVAHVLDTDPLFAPGTGWAYSDTGYVLLGLAIEEVTKRDLFDLIQKRFLNPLTMRQTSPADRRDLPGLAVGYTAPDNGLGLPTRLMDTDGRLVWNPAFEWAGGGLISTSGDLARWGQLLFTGRAMKPSYLSGLLDGAPVHPDAPGVLYGAGVAIYSETPMGPVYGHGGWVPGYVSSLRHYADAGVTIAFQINSDAQPEDSDLVPALEQALAELILSSATAK